MSFATYANLQTEIQNWMDDGDLAGYAADFITLGENRIKRDFRCRQMVKRATATADTSSRYLDLPTGFIAAKRIQLNTTPLHVINFVGPDEINQYHHSTGGKPNFYTVNGDELEFNRVFDDTYTVEINYYKLTALSDSSTTNEIFPEFAELYLYASLAEAATFTALDAEYDQKYAMALMRAKTADQWAIYGEGSLVMRPTTVPE